MTALEDGPWLIYDHYLVVSEWSPNFSPSNATIEKIAAWVRISDLHIEYYDAKVLHFIGNRIGKSVKVDKNTLYHERRKYARICVEVELNKPLLAMFELKDRIYKIEYEGLHMLCRTCGKFGHYAEGCPEKRTSEVNNTSTHNNQPPGNIPLGLGEQAEGPWVWCKNQEDQEKGKKVVDTVVQVADMVEIQTQEHDSEFWRKLTKIPRF
ncbi:hypothetical protein A2U01_0014807 [Trifolium medium]|uniref:CCHC-type domain-containing protein n=1 Tax=Trifolium medium TaxID=97028 RepID=A0A392N5S8_9FABA|nr:hypothetical protein [Trifolium medium]